MSQENNEIIAGRNAVHEALRSGRSLNKIILQEGAHGGSLGEIISLAKEYNISIEISKQDKLDKLSPDVKHQGIIALGSPVAFASLEDVFKKAESKGEPPFIILLDELQDPQNVGAIIRTADAAGAHGILLPKRRTCPLNSVVAKISAGAVNYVPIVQIGNISQTLDDLKDRGCWVVGADMDGECVYNSNVKGSIVLVVGAEGRGLGRLVKQKCDLIVSLPMQGGVNSLNASNAAAVLMYEIVRQRMMVK